MADFGFVGPSYEAPSIYQDAQECINFYPEIDPFKQDRGAIALYPTPGLTQILQLNNAPVRGMRALSGGKYLIIIVGSKVYSIVYSNGYVSTQIGNLTTTTGSVSITDNQTYNNGLTAYIVDGPNRYTWIASTNTFAIISTTDGPWTGGNVCDVVDNYIIYNQPNTQNWATTTVNVTTSPALYGSKDGSPDNLVSLIVDRRQVFLLGEVTTEVWTDVGSTIQGITTFPFQRVPGTNMQHGCAAPFSIARFAEMFMFVSKDTRGQAIIGAIQGYQFVRLSTHAVEQTLMNQSIEDAVAYTYQLEGHEMYVVSFPSIDLTWVYDLTTKMWHKWLSWDQASGYHRHRSNCGAFFNNVYLVGDYQNGKIYQLDNAVYTDNGNTIRRLRRAPHLVADLQRQYFNELQIQFQPGVGTTGLSYPLQHNQLTPYSIYISPSAIYTLKQNDQLGVEATAPITNETPTTYPQAMLRWSSDGGSTWSNEHWVTIGQQGKYRNRAIWRRLGWSRDRIFEVAVSDPIKCVIVSANLKGEAGEH
jgi:hypothetical protein